MIVRKTKSSKRAEQAAENAKLAPERQAKLAVMRLLLRDDIIKWEPCMRTDYPGMYFSELIADEILASEYTQILNGRYLAWDAERVPCHYESSRSQKGSFRVILYLDSINFALKPEILAQYKETLSSICNRINDECEEVDSVTYEVSVAKGRLIPAIYAKVILENDNEDPALLLPKIFSYLAANIGLFRGDKRYDAREKQFIENHLKPVKSGGVVLIEMQIPLYYELLKLFDMADRMKAKTIELKASIENITIFAFRKTTPPLPRDVSKIIANLGLLSWHDATNLKEAVFIALAESLENKKKSHRRK